MAGLTKVVLQLQRRTLVPSLHALHTNPEIDFEHSPFTLQREAAPWHSPAGEPRRAGLSSFGAGGANAHVVLEEFAAPLQPEAADEPELIVLSAKTSESLFASCARLAEQLRSPLPQAAELEAALRLWLAQRWQLALEAVSGETPWAGLGLGWPDAVSLARELEARWAIRCEPSHILRTGSAAELALHLAGEHTGSAANSGDRSVSLRDLAYSLQVGRAPFAVRLALIVHSRDELCRALEQLAAQRRATEPVLWAELSKSELGRGSDSAALRDALVGRDLAALARSWICGARVPWHELARTTPARLVSLPSYAFARKSHWFTSQPLEAAPSDDNHGRTRPRALADDACAPRSTPALPLPAARAEVGPERQRALPPTGDTRRQDSCVRIDYQGPHIAIVTMRDEAQRNMFSPELVSGLQQAFADIAQNELLKTVVLTGHERVFAMGGTKEDLLKLAAREKSFTDIPFLYRGLLECPLPVIAAVQGHASGGGLLLGLYADVVVLAEEGIYGVSFMRYGFTPGMGATFIVGDKLGNNLATELLFSGGSLTGRELVQRNASVLVRPQAEVLPHALTIAESFAQKPRESLVLLKRELSERSLRALDPIVTREQAMHERSFALPEVKLSIARHFDAPARAAAMARPARTRARSGGRAKVSLVERGAAAAPASIALPVPAEAPLARNSELRQSRAGVRAQLERAVLTVLKLSPGELSPEASLADLGMDSISAVEIARDLNAALGASVSATDLYDHPSVDALAAWLGGAVKEMGPSGAEPGTRQLIRDVVSRVLHLSESELSDEATWSELGADSIAAVEIARELQQRVGVEIDVAALYAHPSVSALDTFLGGRAQPQPRAAHTVSWLEHVAQLSDSEVDRWLAELQGGAALGQG
jgi:enoyl-CoA hydratase/carnithine racemase/acyl carrier protein